MSYPAVIPLAAKQLSGAAIFTVLYYHYSCAISFQITSIIFFFFALLHAHAIMTETDPSEIAYEQAHIDQSRQMNMAVSNAICLGVAFVAVLLRLLSRRLAGTKNAADDWWVWTALVRKSKSRRKRNDDD